MSDSHPRLPRGPGESATRSEVVRAGILTRTSRFEVLPPLRHVVYPLINLYLQRRSAHSTRHCACAVSCRPRLWNQDMTSAKHGGMHLGHVDPGRGPRAEACQPAMAGQGRGRAPLPTTATLLVARATASLGKSQLSSQLQSFLALSLCKYFTHIFDISKYFGLEIQRIIMQKMVKWLCKS